MQDMMRGMGHARAAPPRPELPHEVVDYCAGRGPVWVFAYGSLMWSPDFPYEEARRAIAHGYHRSFCVLSFDYRGSRGRPGLVLGLDRGGSCGGVAFRLAHREAVPVLERLWSREMTDRVYELRPVRLRSGEGALAALAFIVRRDHPDYAGRLSPEEAARLIAGAAGSRGTCRDYLANTLARLHALGIADPRLRRLVRLVEGLPATGNEGSVSAVQRS